MTNVINFKKIDLGVSHCPKNNLIIQICFGTVPTVHRKKEKEEGKKYISITVQCTSSTTWQDCAVFGRALLQTFVRKSIYILVHMYNKMLKISPYFDLARYYQLVCYTMLIEEVDSLFSPGEQRRQFTLPSLFILILWQDRTLGFFETTKFSFVLNI